MIPEKNTSPTAVKISYPLFLHVHFAKYFSFILLFMVSGVTSFAQDETPAAKRRGSRIIDDTTKQIYGPNTSRYFYEKDVFYNRSLIYPIDTLIKNFHRYNYVQRNSNYYQDLGNIGTAIRPIFYQEPSAIGQRSGFDVYDLYWSSEEIRYYDTKSPYSNMNVILGGKGRSMTRATFSRNINPRLNFGITYRGFFIDKQVPERRGKGDRITRSNYYDIFSSYFSKDSIYRVFVNYKRMFHRIQEFGGVRLDEEDSSFQAYFVPNLKVWLSEAESNDLTMNMHFNHQFMVGKALQVYHTFDRYRQKSKFLDLYETDKDFFPFQNIINDTTNDIVKFKTVRNEVGIKGNLLKLFYNGYYAIRHYSMTNFHLFRPSIGNENFLGGRMELNIDSVGLVSGLAEVKLDSVDLNYRVEGKIESRWFDASLKQLLYRPSFAQQTYRGAHHEWNNDFANIESSQLSGALHYRTSVISLSPGLTFTRLRNYIFFDQMNDTSQVAPIQSNGNQIYISPEFRFSLTFFRHVTFSNQTIYTSFIENADDAIRLPQLFINTQLAYSNIHFNGNLDMHAGVDIHWRSAYYAQAYDPAIRQFYNQDQFKVNAFPIVDLFLNAKIKRGRVFIKWNNLVQVFTKTGYFPTPFYPGQRNIIDFGFDWSFYD